MNRPSWMLAPIEEYDALPLERIARQLSRLNRYAGAVEWSVLQHSLLVWDLVKSQSATCQAWALLHDAAECWIGDALLPAKQIVGLAWSNLETVYDRHIMRLAGICPDEHERAMVADADKHACRLEMTWLESDNGDDARSPLWGLRADACITYWLRLVKGYIGFVNASNRSEVKQ